VSRLPKRRAYTIVGVFTLAAWALIGLASAQGCGAAEATLQSARPWAIAQCDRLAGMRASAVFNRSIYSPGGWPLWAVVCVYPNSAVR
jgi:hypothetical protein